MAEQGELLVPEIDLKRCKERSIVSEDAVTSWTSILKMLQALVGGVVRDLSLMERKRFRDEMHLQSKRVKAPTADAKDGRIALLMSAFSPWQRTSK